MAFEVVRCLFMVGPPEIRRSTTLTPRPNKVIEYDWWVFVSSYCNLFRRLAPFKISKIFNLKQRPGRETKSQNQKIKNGKRNLLWCSRNQHGFRVSYFKPVKKRVEKIRRSSRSTYSQTKQRPYKIFKIDF